MDEEHLNKQSDTTSILKYFFIILFFILLIAGFLVGFNYKNQTNSSDLVNSKTQNELDSETNTSEKKNCFLPITRTSNYKPDDSWEEDGWTGVTLQRPKNYIITWKGEKDGTDVYEIMDSDSGYEATVEQTYILDNQIKIYSLGFPETTFEYFSNTWWQGKSFNYKSFNKLPCTANTWSKTDTGLSPIYYVDRSDGGYSGRSYYVVLDPKDYGIYNEHYEPILVEISVLGGEEAQQFIDVIEAIIHTIKIDSVSVG